MMKRYGERFGADFNRWTFLTGTKAEIAGLAGGSLKLSAVPVPVRRPEEFRRFVHPHHDFRRRGQTRALRGIFETEGEGVDWTKVQPHIVATVRQLERER